MDNDDNPYPKEVVRNISDCTGTDRHWVNSEQTFDHVGHAYLALFQVATFKGWTDIMADATDATDVSVNGCWRDGCQRPELC